MGNNYCLDTTRIPRELELILKIINTEENKISEDWFKDTDWDLFLDLGIHHRAFPILINKLKTIDSSVVPLYVIQQLSNIQMFNTLNMLQFCSEMEFIGKLFNAHKIKILSLKGPILGKELYGDVSLRSSGDLDFLISLEDLDKVDNLLSKNGYEKDDYIQTVLNDWKWRHHHFTYLHPQKKIKIEIHWRLNPGPGKEPSFKELWERRRLSNLTNYPVYYLGREDLFLFLVSHGARHGWSRLRWLLDIKQLTTQSLDWTKLTKSLKKYQYHQMAGQALILCSQLLKTPINKEMGNLIKNQNVKTLAQQSIFYLEKMINLHNEPLPKDISSYHQRHLFALMSKKQKCLFIISFFYPYPEDAKTLPLPIKLHFLYFFLRPFLWIWRKAKYHALS